MPVSHHPVNASLICAARRFLGAALASSLVACGGGGGGGGNGSTVTVVSPSPVNSPYPAYASLAAVCAAPRPAGTLNPLNGQPYDDTQGTLFDEMAWIQAYVNQTYLWYPDVPVVNSAPYVIGATVPYTDPTNNDPGSETLTSNYQVVDAYFNSQRSPLFTKSGKPKDQFHFTYVTTVWDALETSGSEAGFGFTLAVISATPPRDLVVAYVEPNSPASNAPIPITRGMEITSVNGIDVINTPDADALNLALFSPTPGQPYTIAFTYPDSASGNQDTLIAQDVISRPVLTYGALPAPNGAVGYILFTEHIATAESELIAAITSLQSANAGAPVTDLVLDIRYNGGGLLYIASELAYMIAGPGPTANEPFEIDTFNNKNPFGFSLAQDTTPFLSISQGFSGPVGQNLPYLGLSKVYVLTGPDTCSASEAVINGLRGVGVQVIQVGSTTCGKPYGFYPQDNCSTTYFAIQFEGVNADGFGAYADGFIPAGTGGLGNDLPGCQVADDFRHALGDPAEALLAAALQYRGGLGCPPASTIPLQLAPAAPLLRRSPIHTNRILPPR